jgi:hypothetical protein
MLCSVKGSVHGSIVDLIMPKEEKEFSCHQLGLLEPKTKTPNPKIETPRLRETQHTQQMTKRHPQQVRLQSPLS